jgi:hypothetical protein
MPVDAFPDHALATVLAAPTLPGDTTVLVTDATGIGAGDPLLIGPGRASTPSSRASAATRSR